MQERNLIAADSRVTLLGNDIVLVAPADSAVVLEIAPGFPLADALAGGKLAMAETASVPAGKYGKAALEKLGVWDSVAAKRRGGGERPRRARPRVARRGPARHRLHDRREGG